MVFVVVSRKILPLAAAIWSRLSSFSESLPDMLERSSERELV